MEYFVVHGPGDVQGEPVRHGDEYTGFVVDCYGVNDDEGRLLYDSALFSRPKGCDKSGLGARIGLIEALGPARFAGWAEGGEVYRDPWGLGFEYMYEPGEPMGRTRKAQPPTMGRLFAGRWKKTLPASCTLPLHVCRFSEQRPYVVGVPACWARFPSRCSVAPQASHQ